MAAKKKEVAGGKEYKGSAANGGRKIIVEHYKDSSGKLVSGTLLLRTLLRLSTRRSTENYLRAQTWITKIITTITIAQVI
jgi:hypothetical protein